MIYDPATKKSGQGTRYMKEVAAGVSWNGYFLSGSHAYKGKNLEAVDPLPFPVPPKANGRWRIDTKLTTADTLYIRQQNSLYRFKAGDKELTLIADAELRGGK